MKQSWTTTTKHWSGTKFAVWLNKKHIMNFMFHIVLLFVTFLFASCKPAAEESLDDAVVISEQYGNNSTLLTIEIDTIPTRIQDRYNPYIYHPQKYKPSYPLLISEPDNYIPIQTRTANNFDTLVPTNNITGTSYVFPAFGKLPAHKRNGNRKSLQFLIHNEDVGNPAIVYELVGNAYAMNGLYDKALISYKKAEEELQHSPDSTVEFSVQQRIAELHRLINSNDSIIISKYQR